MGELVRLLIILGAVNVAIFALAVGPPNATWSTHHGPDPCMCGAGDGDECAGLPHGHPDYEPGGGDSPRGDT